MEPYHLTPSRCGWRMFYDLQYQESMCKCCHRCSQEQYDVGLPSLQNSYAVGLHWVPRAKSPVTPSIPHRKQPPEHSKNVEERTERKERLKFSVDAILGYNCGEEEDRSRDKDDTLSRTPTSEDAESKKTAGRNAAFATKRAVFSDYQRRQLEQEFLAHKYINKQERKQLSARLCLTESQIRIWFQNRRMKWRNWQEREIMRRKRHATLEQL